MPITNVGSTWRAGNLVFGRSASSTLGRIDFDNIGDTKPIKDLNADTTILAIDSGFTYVCDNSSGTLAITLPLVASTGFASTAPSTDRGLYYTFINANTSGAALTINGASSQTINASSGAFTISEKYGTATVRCLGVSEKEWVATVDPVTT